MPPVPRAEWHLVYPDSASYEIICHNDFAPYNCIFVEGRLEAVIDFDMAGPGPQVWDVAYAAYRFARLGATTVDLSEQGRRLRLFCDAYELAERTSLMEIIARRVEAVATMLLERAAAGDAAFPRHVAEGHVAGYVADAAFLRHRRLQRVPVVAQERRSALCGSIVGHISR